MNYQGVLKKMKVENLETVQYYLDMNTDFLNLNQLLDRDIKISFVRYQCMACKLDKQIYRHGFCKSCFFETPLAGDWIIRPELSTAHLGVEDRDLNYEKSAQLQPHIVYLAFSGSLKVGVTRKAQIPNRWIDQGATKAIEMVEVPNRYLAGITEVSLKKQISDKTNWRKMLQSTQTIEDADLLEKKEDLFPFIPEQVKPYFIKNETEITRLNFPILKTPNKVKSLNLLKTDNYLGKLKGIKGQYLIFEDDTVFNVRGSEGLVVDVFVG